MFDLKLKKEKHRCFSLTAGDRDRTGTGITTHGILSPGRLPVPPRRRLPYVILVKKRDMHVVHIALVGPIGLEPMTLCL